MKVIYIAGWGRSGTTLTGNILGELDGFFATGELSDIWELAFIDKRRCGCGKYILDCEVWGRVLNRPPGAYDVRGAKKFIEVRNRIRSRHLPAMMYFPNASWAEEWAYELGEVVSDLYSRIAEVTGARVLVDSTKSPVYGYVLDRSPNIDLHVLHMIRDPRAVAYSWRGREASGGRSDGRALPRYGVLKSAVFWQLWNRAIEKFWGDRRGRYFRLLYETFSERPKEMLVEILTHFGMPIANLPFIAEHEVYLRGNHNLTGNPNRFDVGKIGIGLDTEWSTAMKRSEQLLVTLICGTLMRRYGYPLRRR